MNQFVNLNITDNVTGNKFPYMVEFRNSIHVFELNPFLYKYKENQVRIYNKNEINLIKDLNYWKAPDIENDKELKPISEDEMIDSADIVLYFPRYSLETYFTNIYYSLYIKTWINGTEIILGNYLITRLNSIATNKIVTFNNVEYYECISTQIIDPWDLQYSDKWKKFRQEICHQKENSNNIGSNIFIEIEPIKHFFQEQYMLHDSCIGCSNSVKLSNNTNDFLSLNLSCNFINQPATESQIDLLLNYNTQYEKSWEGLKKYLYDTYKIQNPIIKYSLALKDKNNIYKYLEKTIYSNSCSFSPEELQIKSWNEYQSGLTLESLVIISDTLQQVDFYLEIKSNEILLTQEIFKYLIMGNTIKIDDKIINNIKLNEIDMKVYNIDVVNKIQKNIVKVDRPQDYKNNIIKNVFYKTYDLEGITLYEDFAVNINLNLNEYINKVKYFYIRIKDVNFNEIGRTASGVIFYISPKKLHLTSRDTGAYYLLDENMNLITTGGYYVQPDPNDDI